MRRIVAVIAILVVALQFAGCFGEKTVVLVVDENMATSLEVGQVLECRLTSNPTTGYRWQIVQFGGNLKSTGPDEYVKSSDLIGSGGTQIFRFKAVKVGNEQLKFEYLRPWEKGAAPIRRNIVRVNIT